MTAPELKKAVLRRMGIIGAAPEKAVDDFVVAFNAAIQQMRSDLPQEARLHFTRDIEEIELEAGIYIYPLPDSVRAVVSPARLTSDERQLHPVASQYEILHFAALHGGSTAVSRPLVYLVHTKSQMEADATAIEIWVAPTPTVTDTMKMQVERELTALAAEDFCESTPATIPVPHQYVESLLVPMICYNMRWSIWFDRKDLIPLIEQDHIIALRRAGMTDPRIPSVAGDTVPGINAAPPQQAKN